MRLIKATILLFLIYQVERYARWGQKFESAGCSTDYWTNHQIPGNAGIVHFVTNIKNDSSRMYGGEMLANILKHRIQVDGAGLHRDAYHRKMFKISQRSNQWMIFLMWAYKKFYPDSYSNIVTVDFSRIKVDPQMEHMMERECYKTFIQSIRRNL